MRDLIRPSSHGEVGGAMGPCMSCVRGVVARRGMLASSVERESPRRVSLCRAVAREASYRGLPHPHLRLPASPRPKSDCQRLHKAFWFLLVNFLSLFSFFLCRAPHCAKVSSSVSQFTPTPLLYFSFFYFSEFFLRAVAFESAGCNYVPVN